MSELRESLRLSLLSNSSELGRERDDEVQKRRKDKQRQREEATMDCRRPPSGRLTSISQRGGKKSCLCHPLWIHVAAVKLHSCDCPSNVHALILEAVCDFQGQLHIKHLSRGICVRRTIRSLSIYQNYTLTNPALIKVEIVPPTF